MAIVDVHGLLPQRRLVIAATYASAVIYFAVLVRGEERDRGTSGTSLTFAAVCFCQLWRTRCSAPCRCRAADRRATRDKAEAYRRSRRSARRHGPRPARGALGQRRGRHRHVLQRGASYGYGTLWMLPVMALLLIVVQETAASCGCVTGKGFASLIREKFGVRKSALAMGALLIANTAVTISEFAGIASGLALFGVPKTCPSRWWRSRVDAHHVRELPPRIEKILLLVSCVFVTYIVAAFLVGPNWGEVAMATVTPIW